MMKKKGRWNLIWRNLTKTLLFRYIITHLHVLLFIIYWRLCFLCLWRSCWWCLPDHMFAASNRTTLVLWICRFNYDSVSVPPFVYNIPSHSLRGWIICSSLPRLCGITVIFLGPLESSGDQMKRSHLESPSKVSQS